MSTQTHENGIQSAPCWAPQKLAAGDGGRLRVGPFTIWVQRKALEWRLAWARGLDPMQEGAEVAVPCPENISDVQVELRRFAFRTTGECFQLRPALADRPVIVGTAEPLSLPPGEELTLYVGTSIWVRVLVGEPGLQLLEEPAFRPSDTWFGPSTRSGEPCYAGRTQAHLDFRDLPLRFHRAISAVTIRNRATDFLAVDRLKLPLPYLSLFLNASGQLWTETIEFDREDDDERAALSLGMTPPQAAGEARRIAGPRQKPDRLALMRVFSGILRGGGSTWTDSEL